jgi:hypothetical protein
MINWGFCGESREPWLEVNGEERNSDLFCAHAGFYGV